MASWIAACQIDAQKEFPALTTRQRTRKIRLKPRISPSNAWQEYLKGAWPAAARRREHLRRLGTDLVSRGSAPQFFHFVLNGQLASLEAYDFEIVHRRMQQRVIDLAFDVAVFPLKLFKMGR